MSFYIPIIISIASIFFFIKKKILVSIFLLGFLIFYGYGFFYSTISMDDCAVVVNCLINLYIFFKYRNEYKIDDYSRIILLCFLFLFLQLVRTMLIGCEIPIYALRVFRISTLLLLYFPLKMLEKKDILRLLRIFYCISFTACIFYFLQFYTHCYLLSGLAGSSASAFMMPMPEDMRFRNLPLLCDFFFIYSICNKERRIFKYDYVVFLLAIVLSQNRLQLGLCLVTVFFYSFFFLKRKKEIVLALLFLFLSFPIIKYTSIYERFSDGNSVSDIASVFSMRGSDDYVSGEGTMMFRFAILYERLEYLIQNNSLLFGVGMMNESSPITESKFNFFFNTHYVSVESGETIIMNIDTPDMTWPVFLFKYGILGCMMLCFFCYAVIKYTWAYRKNTVSLVFSLYAFVFCGLMFSGYLWSYYNTFILLLALSYSRRLENEKCNVLYNNSSL